LKLYCSSVNLLLCDGPPLIGSTSPEGEATCYGTGQPVFLLSRYCFSCRSLYLLVALYANCACKYCIFLVFCRLSCWLFRNFIMYCYRL